MVWSLCNLTQHCPFKQTTISSFPQSSILLKGEIKYKVYDQVFFRALLVVAST